MTHLIALDHTQAEISLETVHKFITKGLNVSDWWHYLPDIYIVSTLKTATNLADSLNAKFPSMRFLVIKVGEQSGDFNGRLNKKAWEWLRKPKKILLKIKPSPPPIGLPAIGPTDLSPIPQPSSRSALLDMLSGKLPPRPQPKPPQSLEEILEKIKKLTGQD